MTYTRTREKDFSVTARLRERDSETFEDGPAPEPESDPYPSFGPLRVVTVDGETVGEETRPLAKCRQTTPVSFHARRKVAG